MILFVFEGVEREPRIFKTLKRLFFGEGEIVVCSFGNNIYELYRQLKSFEGNGDIVSLLREIHADGLPCGVRSSDFSEIYLFFDYDFQNINLSLEEMNRRLKEMLTMFCDETDCGKLFVSYPMLESLSYTKALPDAHFVEYTVFRSDCMARPFKDLAKEFSFYGSLNFLELPDPAHHNIKQHEAERVRQNWLHLVRQHTAKANYICNGQNELPADKLDIAQIKIFNGQCDKYLCDGDQIAVLSGFPLFLYEYFRVLNAATL